MAGGTSVDLRDVLDGLEKLQRAGKDLRPVFRELRPALASDLREHGTRRESPDGVWAPWSASYVDRMMGRKGMRLKGARGRGELPGALTKRGARRLQRPILGKLPALFKFSIERLALEAKSIVPWAGAHQHGDTVGRGARLVARTFAWASDSLVGLLVEKARAHLLWAWNRR